MSSRNLEDNNLQIEKDRLTLTNSFEKKFNLFFDNISNTQLKNASDFRLAFLLGSYCCDSVLRQIKFFRTAGLIKSIAQRFNHLNPFHLQILYDMCNKIQKQAFRKTQNRKDGDYRGLKISFLRDKIRPYLEKLQDKKESHPITYRDNLILIKFAFLSGYNIYMQLIFNKEEELNLKSILNDYDLLKNFDNKIFENIKLWLELPQYKDDNSVKIGMFLGVYYSFMVKLQIEKLNTRSLIKYIQKFLNKSTVSNIVYLISKIGDVSFKLATFIDKSRVTGSLYEKQARIPTLYAYPYQIEIFKLLILNQNPSFNDKLTMFGFFIGLTSIFKSRPSEIEQFILENLIEKEILKSESEKIGWLVGILINEMTYHEKQELGTKRLVNRFFFDLKGFSKSKFIDLLNELNYVQIKLLLIKLKKKKPAFYLNNPNIYLTIYEKFGNLKTDDFLIPEIIISIAKGYHVYLKYIIPKLIFLKNN
ncbi:MAG: hypothetical protein ACTSRG_21500 [Candidatus Helarchaeota archaeon]